jgi:hypothetical protein
MKRSLAGAALLLLASHSLAAQVRLPGLRVQGRTPCEVHPETAVETAALWLAAREALESVSAPATRDTPRFLIQEWRRTLDPAFRLRWERRDTSFLSGRHPFEKSPPGNLQREGYIQRRGWTMIYYGPDAGLLLSEEFLRRHCFERVIGAGATAGLVGLAFAPLPATRATDVAGVLWVDPVRGELRRVEYVWTNPPREARVPGIGGQADFVRLSSGGGGGGWIIQRWNIRMPRPIDELDGPSDGYTDQGGEVLAVLRPTKSPL